MACCLLGRYVARDTALIPVNEDLTIQYRKATIWHPKNFVMSDFRQSGREEV